MNAKTKAEIEKMMKKIKNKNVGAGNWALLLLSIIFIFILVLVISYGIGYVIGLIVSSLFGLKMVGSMATPQFFGLLFVIIAIVKG